ncbi:hypothetical protein CVT25_014351 [Psilocybe cyanescens]|uniref:Uncharacterized protein n=1 Tax=Psilocybe cyanescens TaxID=93625 RepID=A0A409XID8_PSICY|nr:hypothetical protein CVT25_014351 [Psilocybe cyanescens]
MRFRVTDTVSVFIAFVYVAAFLLAFEGLENVTHMDEPLKFSDIFTNPIFRNIVVSPPRDARIVLMTSIIFFEPWQMITSFVKYMLMTPSYINVLNVYAFAIGKKAGEVEAEVPTDEKDSYQRAL